MKFFSYLSCLIIGLLISYVGMYLAYASAPEHFVAMLGLLSLTYIAVIVYVGKKAVEAEGKNYSILLVTPFFLFVGVLQVFSVAATSLGLLSPNSTAFDEACKDVGPKYFKKPSMPVRSVAFDWDGEALPEYNRFQVVFGTRIDNLGYSALPLKSGFEFIETKRSKRDSWAGDGVTAPSPYVRYSLAKSQNIYSLTADILVRYKMVPIRGVPETIADKPKKYEISILDRRSNELLASFRFAINEKQKRGCGLNESSVMDENSFILRVIGGERQSH